MIGVTEMARFAGFLGWPAVFPAFAKAAWLGIVPEFNPFKYNSFPVNGARQSSLLSNALQRQIAEHARTGRLAELPPVLTFQSVVDFTVSTRAIVNALYVHLPANGSELVLFDLNRVRQVRSAVAQERRDRIVPAAARTATQLPHGDPHQRVPGQPRGRRAGDGSGRQPPSRRAALDLLYPLDVFSLSHIALPFPVDDALYGTHARRDGGLRRQPGCDGDARRTRAR